MREIRYDQLNETLYHEKLDNGLEVYVLPKKGFSKTYATFTAKYGSVDNHFQPPGEGAIKVPDGIAHFLEHKMFEEENGDVFQKFSKQGASANAFTSFERTAYLFSCTDQVEKNLETLLDFVQHPYFTDENVEKEKGIIGQEIRMYEDNPDWRVYFGLIESFFKEHPVKIDIAGTVDSIAKITKEMLYKCYYTFYHPSNMLLFVVGHIEPNSIIYLVKQNQSRKNFKPQGEIKRFYPDEPAGVAMPRREIELHVGISKCMFGFKEKQNGLTGDDLLKREIASHILLDILFGPSSDLYQKLYNEGLINDSFGFDYNAETHYGFSLIGGDTKNPDQMISIVQEFIEKKLFNGIEMEEFERARKKKIGGFLRSLNSMEYIANQFTKYRFNDTDMFKNIPELENLTLEEVNKRLKEHMDMTQFAVSIVKPVTT